MSRARLSESIVALLKKPPAPNWGSPLWGHHLDGVLAYWAGEDPRLFNCPFAAVDFDELYLGRVSLAAVYAGREMQVIHTPVWRACTFFACVVNTSDSADIGHWVAVVVDMQAPEWTIEFYDPLGNRPTARLQAWMDGVAASSASRIMSRGCSFSQPHQTDKTSCGLYALLYIRARLDGLARYEYITKPITYSQIRRLWLEAFSHVHA